jgi:hypothetical protein
MGAYEYQTEATVATLVSPSATIVTNTPSYTWNAVYNAAWYFLYVSDSTGTKITQWYSAAQAGCSNGAGTCSIRPETVIANGPAKWWVRTWNLNGPGPWSSAMAFTVAPAAPGKVSQISPIGTIDTNTPAYKWNADPHATWYYLWVGDSTGGKIMQWSTAEQAGCPSGSGSWSEGMTFVAPTPVLPGKVVLISPTETIDTNIPTYEWNTDSHATWYYLWVGDTTGGKIMQWFSTAQAGCSGGTGTCSVKPETPLAAGSAKWWIRTWSPNGLGSWSEPMTFIARTAVLPGKAALISPSGTTDTCTPTYTWNADAHSSWYYLWVNDITGTKIQQWYTAADTGCSSGFGTCSVTPENSLTAGSCTWWIHPWNPNGFGPWSNGMVFGIDSP